VREAWAALAEREAEADAAASTSADAVFGPAADGGYYLLALRAPQPVLFNAIPWSSAETLAVSCARAREAGLRIQLLATEHDVDDLPSLRACGLGAWADELSAPATHRAT
jgi:uncharacterized protein